MLTLIEDNTKFNYKIFSSNLIISEQQNFIRDLEFSLEKLKTQFVIDDKKNYTWIYKLYNTFSLTSSSYYFYQLYQQLVFIIRSYVGDKRPLWFQSWINYHNPTQLLDWHNHDWPFHGYISLDPKNSSTVFEQYSIHNKIGNIYIGPGYRKHKVVANQIFDGPRITIGFDIHDGTNNKGVIPDLFSLIPI